MDTKRAIGYIRVSTAEQVNGFGLEVQDKAIREWCRRHKVRLVRIASDEGLSGSNGLDTRHGLAGALTELEAKRADVLVVMKLDRLARDLVLQETTIAQLRRAGGDVVSITEPEMDGDDHTRDLVRQVLGAIAQYERAVIRSRMAAGKKAKADKGGYIGGAPPLGYRAEAGALVLDPDEAEVVAVIVGLRRDGASYREICAALDEAGHRPRRGGRWQPMVVRRIVQRVEACLVE